MSIAEIFSLIFATIAIIVSAISIYLQYTIEGPNIDILNLHDVQQIAVRKYEFLPKDIQAKFPYVYVTQEGHAIVKIIYGNSGDRNGIVTIKNVKALWRGVESQAGNLTRAMFDYYIVVPAYEIVEQGILLRNIPLTAGTVEIELKFTIERGGYHPRKGKYFHKGITEETLAANLVPPGREDEMPTQVYL